MTDDTPRPGTLMRVPPAVLRRDEPRKPRLWRELLLALVWVELAAAAVWGGWLAAVLLTRGGTP